MLLSAFSLCWLCCWLVADSLHPVCLTCSLLWLHSHCPHPHSLRPQPYALTLFQPSALSPSALSPPPSALGPSTLTDRTPIALTLKLDALQEIGIPDERFTGVFDLAGIALLTAIWLWVHISYAYVFWKFSKEPRVRDQALSDAKFIKFDECIVPPLRPSQEQGSFANLRQITRAASSFRAASKRSSSSPLKQ